MSDHLLNILFLLIHSSVVLFNLFGWIWHRTRVAHLITILLTFLSWSVIGLFYGFGYCPLTDWHWDVKRRLGESHLPNSFVEYYLEKLTGLDWSSGTVDLLVLTTSIAALGCSLWLNIRDWRMKRGQRLESAEGSERYSRAVRN